MAEDHTKRGSGSGIGPVDRQRIEEILEFWFGRLEGPEDFDPTKSELWWSGGEATDQEIARRFGDTVREALAGELTHWTNDARGTLALVLVLDQFTRNLGRGTAQAFAGDRAARELCCTAIDGGIDRQLRLIERGFLYMPLMHAEDRETARRSVDTFDELSREIAASGRAGHPDFRKHARQHAEIIERFGRYPHRNPLLGRTPTAEEQAFVDGGGPSFGQQKRTRHR